MPVYICPHCKDRSIDLDGYEGFTATRTLQCRRCNFGFLFELLEDYYPGPTTGFVVCDADTRVIAAGRGVFELTGYREADLMGRDALEALGLEEGGASSLVHEWGVRKLGVEASLVTRGGIAKTVTADFFPAYDDDGGLLLALTAR